MMNFVNDDVIGAFQRKEKSMVIEPVSLSEIPMVSGDWETFYKGLFQNDESTF